MGESVAGSLIVKVTWCKRIKATHVEQFIVFPALKWFVFASCDLSAEAAGAGWRDVQVGGVRRVSVPDAAWPVPAQQLRVSTCKCSTAALCCVCVWGGGGVISVERRLTDVWCVRVFLIIQRVSNESRRQRSLEEVNGIHQCLRVSDVQTVLISVSSASTFSASLLLWRS